MSNGIILGLLATALKPGIAEYTPAPVVAELDDVGPCFSASKPRIDTVLKFGAHSTVSIHLEKRFMVPS